MPSKKSEKKNGNSAISLALGIYALLMAFGTLTSSLIAMLLGLLAVKYGQTANEEETRRAANFGIVLGGISIVIALLTAITSVF